MGQGGEDAFIAWRRYGNKVQHDTIGRTSQALHDETVDVVVLWLLIKAEWLYVLYEGDERQR